MTQQLWFKFDCLVLLQQSKPHVPRDWGWKKLQIAHYPLTHFASLIFFFLFFFSFFFYIWISWNECTFLLFYRYYNNNNQVLVPKLRLVMDLQQTSQNWLCIQLPSIFSKEFPILVFQPIHLYMVRSNLPPHQG